MRGQNADSKQSRLSFTRLEVNVIAGSQSRDRRQAQIVELIKLLGRASAMKKAEERERDVVAA